MTEIVTIDRESVEKLACTIKSDVDPTGDPIDFALAAPGRRPTTWSAGEWVGTPVQRGNHLETTARTPLIGAAPLDLAPGRWAVWCRYNSALSTFVRIVGEVVVR